jgi:hypothetical protein
MSRITRRFSQQPSSSSQTHRRSLHPWALVATPKVDDDHNEDDSHPSNDYDENSLHTPAQSPPSKSAARTVTTTPYSLSSTPSASHRSFGEEMEGHHSNSSNNNRIIIDTTLVVEQAARQQERERLGQSYNHHIPTGATTLTTTMSSMDPNDETGTVISDTQSQVSSVAHLRGLLDGFGKQRKEHFERTTTKIAPEEAQRPTRPKVKKTAERPNKPTPLPPQAASALARRLVDTGLPSHPYTRCTPIRIKPKESQHDVRATDQGYKSVAQLSAWLAEDPTKSKQKSKVLRRGANVIAKSRAFDKNLVDVLIEQDMGGRSTKGLVAYTKKQLLAAPSMSGSESGGSDSNANNLAVQEWPETASTISVSHKKQWLKHAFQQPEEAQAPAPKAHTEVVTAQDGRAAVSNRAKHMWRQRLPKKETPTKAMECSVQESEVVASPSETPTKRVSSPHRVSSRGVRSTTAFVMRRPVSKATPVATRIEADGPKEVVAESRLSPEEATPESTMEPPPPRKPLSGFSAARDQLVQRAHQNGNPVNVTTRVKNRAAKFERLEKESRRKSQAHGNLKSTWVEDEDRPSNSYVRSFVSNVAPPKAFEELP